jgi:hypothetical protein
VAICRWPHLSRRRKVNRLTVLGELVQTTVGKWITHPPPRCPTATPSAARLLLDCRCADSTDADHGTDPDDGEELDVTCSHDGPRLSTPTRYPPDR